MNRFEKGAEMRKKLKEARQKAGMTQQQIADQLKISERYYRFIEAGTRDGDFKIWNALEDLFKVHQRELRSETKSHPSESGKRNLSGSPQS